MSNEFDVAVVGGGIAGMSAGLTAARLGRRTIVITGGVPGGQLVSIDRIEGVAGFPDGVPGYDFCPMTQEQAVAAGVELSMDRCESLVAEGDGWVLTGPEGVVKARGVIIATGTALARLNVDGEKRLAGKGVSECASCDAPLLRNKIAVVVGGGDSAMQEALTLAEHVAKVIMIEREADLSGQQAYREKIRENGKIEVLTGSTVSAILGENVVTHVRVKSASGESDVETAAVFPFVGLMPNSDVAATLVARDESGRIQVDAALRSTARGICAAGNVREASPHRAASAMGDGATAALTIDSYLGTGVWRGA